MLRRLAQCAVVVAALTLLAFAWRCDATWIDKHVFLPQQFFIRAAGGIVFWSRAAAGATGAVLLTLVPVLPRGAAGRRLLVAVLLAVAAGEVLLQWRMRHLGRPGLAAAMDALTTSHPRYGVSLARRLDRWLPMSGRSVRFRTDAEGRRFSGVAIDPALPSLIFTGESTAAGIGLQWEETFAALLGARLRMQVVNLASPAYRLDQSWLRLKDALPELEHPGAVVGVFMPGLIGRSFAGQPHPLARPLPGGAIDLVGLEAPALLHRSGLYRLWRHLYWSEDELDEGMRSAAAVLRDVAALARSRGAPCVFLVTGRTPSWMVHDLFEVPALDHVVVEVPEEELLADGHPGARGSTRIADALEGRLRVLVANR